MIKKHNKAQVEKKMVYIERPVHIKLTEVKARLNAKYPTYTKAIQFLLDNQK